MRPKNYQMQDGFNQMRPRNMQMQDNTYMRPKNYQSQDSGYMRPRFKNTYQDQPQEMQEHRQYGGFKQRGSDQRPRFNQPKRFPNPVSYFYFRINIEEMILINI